MAVIEGKAYWASVTTPNPTFEPVYTVDLVVSDEVANDFEARGFRVKDLSIKDEQGASTNVGRALTIKRKEMVQMAWLEMPLNFLIKRKISWMMSWVMALL